MLTSIVSPGNAVFAYNLPLCTLHMRDKQMLLLKDMHYRYFETVIL